MVVLTWWEEQIETGIAITKMRIKHHEKHGCGTNVIKDKAKLQKQERYKITRKEKL